MTAYVLFLREETLDQTELDAYFSAVGPASAGHSMSALVRGGAMESIEGELPEAVILLAFADMAAARAWQADHRYKAAAQHRIAGARSRALIVEGLQ